MTIKCSLVHAFCQPIQCLSISAFKSIIVNPSTTAGRNSKIKIKGRNLCLVQFSLPDRWKPYNKINDENLCLVQFSLPNRWKPYNKIKDKNLCSVQFSLPDRWKPYNKIKDRNLCSVQFSLPNRWKSYNKIKGRNLCSVQFSLPDRWKPYHETKGRGLSPDKLNMIIFLIIFTVSSQMPELVLMKLGMIVSCYCQ